MDGSVDPPILKQEGTVPDKLPRLYPVITIPCDQISSYRVERGECAKIEKIWCGLFERDPKGSFIQCLYSDG